MCSLSWHKDSAFHVVFNRDEQRTRARSSDPLITRGFKAKGVYCLDPDSGGTWLLANSWGLVVAVMNWPGRITNSGSKPASRGRLPLLAIDLASPASWGERLKQEDFSCTPPFQTVALHPSFPPVIHRWYDDLLHPVEPPTSCFLTTSSIRMEEIAEARERRFLAIMEKGRSLSRLQEAHRDHSDAEGSRNIFMDRPDARTVSITTITIEAERVNFLHERREENPQSVAIDREIDVAICSS